MGFEPPSGIVRPAYQQRQAEEANAFSEKMSEIEGLIRDEMRWAQAVYEETTNRSRAPAPAYRVGDEVWLDTRHIETRRPSKKLDWKNIGKLRVVQVVSPHAYKLNLPESMKIHPVFHTSLLRPAAPDDLALPGQIQPPPPPVEVNGNPEYLIESIEDSRYFGRNRTVKYFVKWQGHTERTWEPAENFKETAAAEQYHLRYPDRPKPPGFTI